MFYPSVDTIQHLAVPFKKEVHDRHFLISCSIFSFFILSYLLIISNISTEMPEKPLSFTCGYVSVLTAAKRGSSKANLNPALVSGSAPSDVPWLVGSTA
jgi:hypothetical protein